MSDGGIISAILFGCASLGAAIGLSIGHYWNRREIEREKRVWP